MGLDAAGDPTPFHENGVTPTIAGEKGDRRMTGRQHPRDRLDTPDEPVIQVRLSCIVVSVEAGIDTKEEDVGRVETDVNPTQVAQRLEEQPCAHHKDQRHTDLSHEERVAEQGSWPHNAVAA